MYNMAIVNTTVLYMWKFLVLIQDGNVEKSWTYILSYTDWIYSYEWNSIFWRNLRIVIEPLHTGQLRGKPHTVARQD